MAQIVVGLFDTLEHAQGAVQELVDIGWDRADISLITPQPAEGAHAHKPGIAVKDAEKGAVVGGLAGLFLGLSELAVPGVGAVLAGGWLVTTLLGAGLGAATGGLVGSLVQWGISHEEARHFAEGLRRGGTLVTIKTDDARRQQAIDLLQRHHAVNIQERAAQWQQQG